MLSYDDCLGMCALTPDEVIAVAHHEHIPVIVAAELGDYLCESSDGLIRLARIVKEDLDDAVMRRDYLLAVKLRDIVRQFLDLHPQAHQCRDAVLTVLEVPCN